MGTMTNAVPFLFGQSVLSVLWTGALGIDKDILFCAEWANFGLLCVHFWTTLSARAKHHVHTYDIGETRFKRGPATEFLIGMFISLGILTFAPIVGLWLMASVFCSMIHTGMIEQRDKWRAIKIKDELERQKAMARYYV